MTLRLDEDHARKLDELAQRAGTSKHEAVLHAINEEYNRMTHRQRVTDALNQSVERWGDALERLGQVTPCEFLSLEDLLDIVSALTIGPVRDLGLLNAAALRPQTTLMGQDAYPSTAAKAAALLESLTKNHALIDGNKRLAWAACSVFLSLNAPEIQTDVSNDDVYELVIAIASSQITMEKVCATLSEWTATRP